MFTGFVSIEQGTKKQASQLRRCKLYEAPGEIIIEYSHKN